MCENIGFPNFPLNTFQALVTLNVRNDADAFPVVCQSSSTLFATIFATHKDLSNELITQDTAAARVSGTQKSWKQQESGLPRVIMHHFSCTKRLGNNE